MKLQDILESSSLPFQRRRWNNKTRRFEIHTTNPVKRNKQRARYLRTKGKQMMRHKLWLQSARGIKATRRAAFRHKMYADYYKKAKSRTI